jgi:type IX secretion system PorP/SprF family membrane protein
MKKISLLFIVFFGCFSLNAQQYPLFSNYITNCFGFNPAVTGALEGVEGRLMYRNQWTGFKLSPETSLANVNGRFKKVPIGLGATFFKDGAGRLNRTGGSGSIAFHQKLGASMSASVGASFGYYKNVLQQNFMADDMADPILANATQGRWAPDMNVGIYLRYKGLYAGGSAPQFLERILKFQSNPDDLNESILKRHYYYFAGYRQYFGSMYAEPSVMVKTIENAPLQWDAGLKFGTGTPLWLGASYRNKAAAAVMAGLDFSNGLGVAYAFDLTTSGIKKLSNSSHELTLVYRKSKCKDMDKDGICDKEDKCPSEPGAIEDKGCPKKEEKKEKEKCKDTDADGICDTEDECIDVPGKKENKGCPLNDRDKDGIPDEKDKCPDTPGFKQFEGCPMNDRDNDGLRDDIDKCPDEAGPVDKFGCPMGKGDGDGDGVLDDDDQCPNTPGLSDNSGCPKPTKDERESLNLAIENLYFDTDKWNIKPSAKPHMDKLSKVLANHRDWKIRVSGHADARGNTEHNLMLSKNRAESAMYYLIARGVKREQIVVEYYGSNVPVGDNKTKPGLDVNRRTELEFVFN